MASTVLAKSQPLHNFPLSHLKWSSGHQRPRSSSNSAARLSSAFPHRSSPLTQGFSQHQSPLRQSLPSLHSPFLGDESTSSLRSDPSSLSESTGEEAQPMYNLFMEYLPGGTLCDQIKKQGVYLEEPMIQKFAYQILQGLDYLHSKGIVHCDIKGHNVLIGKNEAKIGDFGCAKMVEEGNRIAEKSTISSTPLFMAPEVAHGEEQGFAVDIWAVGCVVVEIAIGNNPWPNMNGPVSALYKIGYSRDVPECPIGLSNSTKDFLSKCLTRDPNDR